MSGEKRSIIQPFNTFLVGATSTFAFIVVIIFFSRISLDHIGAYTLSFADLSAILLAASAIIVTVLGLVLAILGLVGWKNLKESVVNDSIASAKQAAEQAAKDAAIDHVKKEMETDGILRKAMQDHVGQLLNNNIRRDPNPYTDELDEYGGQ